MKLPTAPRVCPGMARTRCSLPALVLRGALGLALTSPALVACSASGDARAAVSAGPPDARHAKGGARTATAAATNAPVGATADSAPDECPRAVDPFSEASLRHDVTVLASPALDGRAPGSAGDVATRAYLMQRFRCFGLTPGGDGGGFEQRFIPADAIAADGDGDGATANLVGYLPGTGQRGGGPSDDDGRGDSGGHDRADPELASQIILVTAHHDHLGDGHLGANDNASGTAALLAIAQAVAARGGHRRTIAFAAFGAEELGLVGSTYYVAHPPAALPLDRVVQVVNLDMIGSYSAKQRVHAFGAFPGLPATRLLRRLDAATPRTRFSIGGHSVRGDHHGFCQLDIPYVFFWTPDGRCYHQRCDTAERVDYPHLADIAAVAGALVERLADGDADLAAARARHGCSGR